MARFQTSAESNYLALRNNHKYKTRSTTSRTTIGDSTPQKQTTTTLTIKYLRQVYYDLILWAFLAKHIGWSLWNYILVSWKDQTMHFTRPCNILDLWTPLHLSTWKFWSCIFLIEVSTRRKFETNYEPLKKVITTKDHWTFSNLI